MKLLYRWCACALRLAPTWTSGGTPVTFAHSVKMSFTALCMAGAMMATQVMPACAAPALQVYIEGATYDAGTGTWIGGPGSFRLWVIANVKQKGIITDVKLSAAFRTGEVGAISITPTTTSLVSDPSIPASPILDGSVGADGSRPTMSDGKSLSSHAIYRRGTSFKQWNLGDFTLADSPVGDFTDGFPTSFPSAGQINAYDISISGFSVVHFDTFDHVEGANHATFAPFSHDAEAR